MLSLPEYRLIGSQEAYKLQKLCSKLLHLKLVRLLFSSLLKHQSYCFLYANIRVQQLIVFFCAQPTITASTDIAVQELVVIALALTL